MERVPVEDVSVESVRFGHRGQAPVLTGPGLGIRVVEERLRRRAVAVRVLGAGFPGSELSEER